MRTVTEFPGVVIRLVSKTRADLVAAGTAEDQLEASIGQAHKLEGERLTHLVKALAMVGNRADQVARVRVFQGEDESKMPKGVVKEGDFFYLVEFTAAPAPKKGRDDERPGKGGKGGRGKKGGRGGRDGGKGRGEKRGEGRGAQARGEKPRAPQAQS